MSDLTIEQMCRIIDNAPNWAKGYNTAIQEYTRSVWFSKDILLSDLKAHIDQYYYGQSEEKELEQYAILSQEKIEGGAVLIGRPNIQRMIDYQDVIAKQQCEIYQLKAEKVVLEGRTAKALQMLKDWGDQTFRDDMEQLIGELGDVLRGGS